MSEEYKDLNLVLQIYQVSNKSFSITPIHANLLFNGSFLECNFTTGIRLTKVAVGKPNFYVDMCNNSHLWMTLGEELIVTCRSKQEKEEVLADIKIALIKINGEASKFGK